MILIQGCPISPFLFNIALEVVARAFKLGKRKGIKTIINTVFVCKWCDVYMGNPIHSTEKLLALINEFGKAAGYKIKIWQSVTCIYTNNELSA